MTDAKNTYSQKYYATYDITAAQPTPVTGWIDISLFTTIPDWLPNEASLIALTDDEWSVRQSGLWGISDGKLVSYTLPTLVIPLTTQAQTAQAWIQQQASFAAAMGEVFTADMKAYVKAINAIASGTDTTSTALPAQPEDVMITSTATS